VPASAALLASGALGKACSMAVRLRLYIELSMAANDTSSPAPENVQQTSLNIWCFVVNTALSTGASDGVSLR